jgi:hypothetical protein
VVCGVVFFVAILIAEWTCCPMRAMAAPSAVIAEACGAKVIETADAATTANKVNLICFLLDDLQVSEHRTRQHGAGRRVTLITLLPRVSMVSASW